MMAAGQLPFQRLLYDGRDTNFDPPCTPGNFVFPAELGFASFPAFTLPEVSSEVPTPPGGEAGTCHPFHSDSPPSSDPPASSPEQPAPALDAKERIRLTHRRFRQRKKEKLSNLQKQLQGVQQQAQSLADANHRLHLRNEVLDGVLRCLEDHLSFSKRVELAKASGGATAATPAQAAELQLLAEMYNKCDRFTVEDHLALRQGYVLQAMPLLLEAERDPSSEAMRQLQRLKWDQQLHSKIFAVLEPEPAHVHAAFLDGLALDWAPTGAPEAHLHTDTDVTDHQRWAAVIATLNLSEDQKLTALMARKLMLDNLQKLSCERGTLGALGSELVPDSSAAFLTAQRRMESVELPLAEELHRNVMRQKHVHVLMFMYLFEHILDDVQYAKLWVHCFPRVPFALNIMNVIAAERTADQLYL